MSLILRYLAPRKWLVTYSLSFKVIGTLADIFLPFLISFTIDEIVPTVTKESLGPVYLMGSFMLLIAVIGIVFNISANRLSEKVASHTVYEVRNDLFSNILLLSPNQVDEVQLSSLIARMTNDTYNIYHVIGSLQRLGIRAPILFLGGLTMSFIIDAQLSLIMLALLPVITFVVVFVFLKAQPMYREIHEQSDEVLLILRENIVGHKTIRALSMTEHEIDRFDQAVAKLVEKELKATVLMNKIRPIVDLLLNTGLVLALILGSIRVFNGYTTVADLLVLLTYYTFVINSIMSITRVFMNIARSNISGNRVQKVLDYSEDIKYGNKEIKEENKLPHLELKNVSFSYHDKRSKDTYVLDDISFKVNQGETLAILGPTGSGKSTLIRLLLRFYEPSKGSIEIFGKPLKEYDLNNLRKHFGVVFQNDIIFSDTIYENIRFYRDEISKEDVEFAAKVAQASFINEKEFGLDHELAQRGTNLSGGQRQRLLIARALAHKPGIIVMDDSSSALDYKTDSSLRNDLKTYFKDRTKIIVAQRISSVREASKIILIDGGKIIGMGTHDQLIESNEYYQSIYKQQAGDIDYAL